MASGRLQLGSDGERCAERFLRSRGYAILARNYRCALGEVDLVALDGRTVVFIEVKTRRAADREALFDSVDPRKQRQIVRAAEQYVLAHRLADRDVRFDVVGVSPQAGGFACDLVQDAFAADDGDGW